MQEDSQLTFFGKLKSNWSAFKQKYPRASWAAVGIISAGSLLFFGLILFILLVYRGWFGDLPSYAELENIQNDTASEVYSEDGVLLGKYYIQNRVNADFDELSPFLLDALVATEDARFFEHRGVDFRAMMRVFFKSILLQQSNAGGGSTLSQQLAKNLYGRHETGALAVPVTKVKEMFTARRLEKIYTKEELLKLYLNTVPFGTDVYGVKVAAQRFFNTSPADLSVEDAATLVGMLKANTRYNPVRNPELATGRRNTVLAQMVKYEYLPASELDSLQKRPIEVKYSDEGHNKGTATYFREHLRQELKDILAKIKKPNGKPYNLYRDGLKIHTTINAEWQQMAEAAVQEHLVELQKLFDKDHNTAEVNKLAQTIKRKSARYKKLKKAGLSEKQIDENFSTPVKMRVFSPGQNREEVQEMSPLDSIKYYLTMLNAGFMVMQPQTGKVQAWVGGIDQKYFQYDHVKAQRQVGSTFKPIVYGEALRQDFSPCDYLSNHLVTYTDYDDWTPRNSDNEYGGLYSMKGGLSKSVNTATVDMIMKTGVAEVKQFAEELGIKSTIPEVPSIALGTPNISLREMVRAYAAFANRGKLPQEYYLSKIENNRGEVIYEFEKPNKAEFPQVINKEDNAMLTHMLQAVVDSGTARRLRFAHLLDNDIAGKTGTTQDQSDGWFMGYTPVFVAGAWVGAEYPTVHWKSLALGQGARTALPIWGKFAEKLYAHPDYAKLKRATFMPLALEQELSMDCPLFIESEEVLDEMQREKELDELFNTKLKDIFTKDRNGDEVVRKPRVNKKPNGPQRQSTASERIKEKNRRLEEKREKKKKRKKFFDRLFGNQQ